MAGIRTGLRDVDADYAVVVACDMPFVDPAFVAHLRERAAGHDAAVPRVGKWFQPTHAVYRAERMADACDRALERDERRIVAPLEELEYVVVEGEEVRERASERTFESVDTRADLAEAEAHLS
jgi:molybdopterin-guanine dinucleotide biosynthesis protein A